jgi:5-aminopentanamidase
MEKVDMRVGTYQNVNLRNNIPEAISVIEAIVRSNASQELDLILFPELFLTGYDCGVEILISSALHMNSKEIEYIRSNICQQYHIALCFGYSEQADNETIYNSAMLIDAMGEVVMNYRKTHLWDPNHSYEKCAFTPGEALPVADLLVMRTNQTIRVGILICFDLEFPEPARVLRLSGASLILVPTAVVDTMPAQCMVRCRACENLLFIIYSNFTGPCLISSPPHSSFCGLSGVFGPDGSELVRASAEATGLFTAQLIGREYGDYAFRNNYLLERQEKCQHHLYASITTHSSST